ncbi:hypothetical protein TNCV_1456191 [Trichonephila clavipes]|nr:hypothetical protein TNCV_1456191 [Trichonephila clavipes]
MEQDLLTVTAPVGKEERRVLLVKRNSMTCYVTRTSPELVHHSQNFHPKPQRASSASAIPNTEHAFAARTARLPWPFSGFAYTVLLMA